MLDLFIGIEMEPALTAFIFRSAVPGERKRLQAAIGKFHEILLQGIEAERVLHLKRGKFAVGAIGLHEELAVLAEKAGMHPVVVEARIIEIAKHGLVRRVIHRVLVLRAMPRLRFDVVALGTGLAADECGGCFRTRRQHADRRVARTEGQELKYQTYC